MINEITEKETKTIIVIKPANPSIPSIKLKALITATIKTIVKKVLAKK